jgi:hypothetical protein
MIKLFTMVKDESDIIRDWILYHGYLFGYENLFIIDNMSTDGTFEIMHEFLNNGIHIFRETNYAEKGFFMKKLIDGNCHGDDIAFPLDIDEFIVYYENGNKDIICDKDIINNHIYSLGNRSSIYKANYIQSVITDNNGYEKATRDNKWGAYSDYGKQAKSFFKINLYRGNIDHGNHIHTDNYILSNICLVHFHCRNLEQMRKKVYNNVTGFGYPDNLEALKNIISNNNKCNGYHHILHYISFLENTYSLSVWGYNDTFINLHNLNKFFY